MRQPREAQSDESQHEGLLKQYPDLAVFLRNITLILILVSTVTVVAAAKGVTLNSILDLLANDGNEAARGDTDHPSSSRGTGAGRERGAEGGRSAGRGVRRPTPAPESIIYQEHALVEEIRTLFLRATNEGFGVSGGFDGVSTTSLRFNEGWEEYTGEGPLKAGPTFAKYKFHVRLDGSAWFRANGEEGIMAGEDIRRISAAFEKWSKTPYRNK